MKKEIKLKPPKYAMVGNTEMRLKNNRYYRDAGNWDIGFKEVNGKLVTKSLYGMGMSHMRGLLITEITKEEYMFANKEYLPLELKKDYILWQKQKD